MLKPDCSIVIVDSAFSPTPTIGTYAILAPNVVQTTWGDVYILVRLHNTAVLFPTSRLEDLCSYVGPARRQTGIAIGTDVPPAALETMVSLDHACAIQ